MNNVKRSVLDELKSNGTQQYLFSKFFSHIAFEASQSKSPLLITHLQNKNSNANQIAARLVYEFFMRNKLQLTLNTVSCECPETQISKNNQAALSPLHLRSSKPYIQKLVRQRCISKEEQGWYNIDSDNEETVEPSGEYDPVYAFDLGLETNDNSGSVTVKSRSKLM